MAIYIIGIMFYKFGLELVSSWSRTRSSPFFPNLRPHVKFVGSITTLATDRFTETDPSNAFAKVGILQGFNQAMQCTYSWDNERCSTDSNVVGIGAILIAPLIKHYHTRSVLAIAVFGFGLVTAVLLICDGMYFLSPLSSITLAHP